MLVRELIPGRTLALRR